VKVQARARAVEGAAGPEPSRAEPGSLLELAVRRV